MQPTKKTKTYKLFEECEQYFQPVAKRDRPSYCSRTAEQCSFLNRSVLTCKGWKDVSIILTFCNFEILTVKWVLQCKSIFSFKTSESAIQVNHFVLKMMFLHFVNFFLLFVRLLVGFWDDTALLMMFHISYIFFRENIKEQFAKEFRFNIVINIVLFQIFLFLFFESHQRELSS